MPTLPLPPDAPIGGGDLPVVDDADVLAVFPSFVRASDSADVRDAIVAGLREMFLEYQRRAEYAAAQSDILRAVDVALEGLGADRGVYKIAGESNPDYRARILAFPELVTPQAILAAVNAILAPLTPIRARYLEELDAWFISDGTTPWSSHVYDGTANASPVYLDRLYPDDAATNGGYACEGREPGGARVFEDQIGRFFEIRIPDLGPLDTNVSGVYASTSEGGLDGFFCGDGTSDLNISFAFDSAAAEFDVYAAICTVIDRIKGQSMRVQVFADPQLVE